MQNERLPTSLRHWPALAIAALGGLFELFALWRARQLQRRT
jgi:hypothetical protein